MKKTKKKLKQMIPGILIGLAVLTIVSAYYTYIVTTCIGLGILLICALEYHRVAPWATATLGNLKRQSWPRAQKTITFLLFLGEASLKGMAFLAKHATKRRKKAYRLAWVLLLSGLALQAIGLSGFGGIVQELLLLGGVCLVFYVLLGGKWK